MLAYFAKLLSVTLILAGLVQTPAPPQSPPPVPSPTPQKPTPTPQKKPAIAKQPALTSRVIVISVSGLSSDHILRPERYKLRIPNIIALRNRGSYAASVEGVYPSLSLPAHASMITGMLPSDHGIYANSPFNLQAGSAEPAPFAEISQPSIDSVWESARRSGLKSLSLDFPLTAKSPVDFRLTKADGIEALLGSIAANRINLSILNLTEFSEAEARFGIGSREALLAIEGIDAQLGVIAEKQGSESTFILTSDSALAPVEREFHPNAILATKGLITFDKQGRVESWRAMASATGGSASVYVKDLKDEKLIADVDKAFREIYDKPESPIWRIISRQEAVRIGADPRAALFLDAAPLFVMSSKMTTAISGRSETRATAGYLPQRSEMRPAFIIAGRGIKAGVRMEFTRLIDIAPTVSRLLGLELRTSRGRVLEEVLVK
jgi:predicted AlkP superfamily pyrophosphatase or phosphodiesterase